MQSAVNRPRPAAAPPPPREGVMPPHSLAAEAAVVSTCLLNASAIDTVRALVEPGHCYAKAHSLILEAIYHLDDAQQPVDLVTVSTRLRSQQRLDEAGGNAYLAQIVDATPAVANVEEHGRIVRDLWRVRQAILLFQLKTSEGLTAPIESVQEWLEGAEHALEQINGIGQEGDLELVGSVAASYYATLKSARERGTSLLGAPTGFVDLDQKTGGLFGGDLIVVAGRPGLGKTSLATSIARAVATPHDDEPGLGVAFFSLEMPKAQIGMRMMCAEEQLDAARVRRGELGDGDWSRLMRAAATLSQLPIWIDDTPAITVAELRSKTRRLQRLIEHGKTNVPCKKLGLVCVDYLQLMKGVRERGDTREREVASLSSGLKNLAKRLQVPVLALSQLNRSVEQKAAKDKRPRLSDLRESGAIENDADAVWLLYRDSYYDRTAGPEVEIDLAKQRSGPTGVVTLHFYAKCMAYANATSDEYGSMTGAEEWDVNV